jgi:hypothetical protein
MAATGFDHQFSKVETSIVQIGWRKRSCLRSCCFRPSPQNRRPGPNSADQLPRISRSWSRSVRAGVPSSAAQHASARQGSRQLVAASAQSFVIAASTTFACRGIMRGCSHHLWRKCSRMPKALGSGAQRAAWTIESSITHETRRRPSSSSERRHRGTQASRTRGFRCPKRCWWMVR